MMNPTLADVSDVRACFMQTLKKVVLFVIRQIRYHKKVQGSFEAAVCATLGQCFTGMEYVVSVLKLTLSKSCKTECKTWTKLLTLAVRAALKPY